MSGFVLPRERALAVMRGEVTRVYVPRKADDYGWVCGHFGDASLGLAYSSVHTTKEPNHVTRFVRDESYPVRYGRGKALGRVTVLSIGSVLIDEVSLPHMRQAGYMTPEGFYEEWASKIYPLAVKDYRGMYKRDPDEWVAFLKGLLLAAHAVKAERLQAWSIEVEVAR